MLARGMLFIVGKRDLTLGQARPGLSQSITTFVRHRPGRQSQRRPGKSGAQGLVDQVNQVR